VKNYFLATILFLLSGFTHAQSYLPPLVTLSVPSNIMPYDQIYCIEEDRFGKKYIGTTRGINIYDGTAWTNYGYPANFNSWDVYAIAIDSLDNTWIGMSDGVYVKDTNNTWSSVTAPFTTCNQIAIDHQGNKWFIGSTAIAGFQNQYELARFDGTNWVRFDSTNTPAFINQDYKMLLDSNDNIFLMGVGSPPLNNSTLLKFDGVNWTTYAPIPFGVPTGRATAFTIDQSNNIWMVMSDHVSKQLQRFDGNTFTVIPDTNLTFFLGQYTSLSITVDKWGNKWIASDMGSLYKYDGSEWKEYLTSTFTGFGYIKAFGENIWLSHSMGVLDSNIYILNERGCNQIKGRVYLDSNADNIFQPSEQILSNLMLHLTPHDKYVYSNDPEYVFPLMDSIGSYTIEIMPPSNWVTASPLQNVTQTFFGEITDSVDFGIHPLTNSNNVSINHTTGALRPGFNTTTWINYKSNSAHPLSDTIVFIKDPLMTYLNSSPSPVTQNGDTIKWYYANLLPFESRTIVVNFSVSASAPLGNIVLLHSEIHPISTDTFPSDNFYNTEDSIRGSYDPNSKEVNQDGPILPTQKIEYTIHFQNTGTDTAFTVVLHDTISTWFDISKLEILGSSHPVNYQLSDRALIFTFSSILLPDSSVNEPMSHGFVKYSIIPLPGIPDGTLIENVAAIYFDYNIPVITNSTQNSIDYFLSTGRVIAGCYPKIYPNPATEKITIPALSGKKFEIYNALGKMVLMGLLENSKGNFDIDIHNLQAGIYFIKIEKESAFVVSRFIKQ
jgi:hypothetical protein